MPPFDCYYKKLRSRNDCLDSIAFLVRVISQATLKLPLIAYFSTFDQNHLFLTLFLITHQGLSSVLQALTHVHITFE